MKNKYYKVTGPGWNLDRPGPFQPPSTPRRFHPHYDLFFRQTCHADRSGSFPIMGGL